MPNYLFLGASRNIGLHVVTRLLISATDATCTLLLRSPDSFIPSNPSLAKFVENGQLRLVKGDATQVKDIAQVWEEAGKGGKVDCILSSIGGTPKGVSLTKGFTISQADICSTAIVALLRHLHSLSLAPADQPRVIAVSSMGLTKADHAKLPWYEKTFYGWALQLPHADKLAMEYFLHHSADIAWPSDEPMPDYVVEKEKSEGALTALSPRGWLKDVVFVRPAFLIDPNEEKVGKKPRVSDNFSKLPATVSRKAVADFIVEECLSAPGQCKWSRKMPVVGW